MRLSIDWLREFVPFEGETQVLADRLTMLGLEVEAVERPFAHLSAYRVGHVLECSRHPQADKLSVCLVDAGLEAAVQVVCGAPNVAAGQKVALAPVGTTMPDGTLIKKAALRGVESCGMICSERELGLSEDHAGIMVLPERARPGQTLAAALELGGEVLEVGITPNRADCLSILGLAREVGLAFDLPVTLPRVELKESGEDAAGLWTIDIKDPEHCPVYQARVIRGVKVGQSPARIRYRLISMGVRPISNIVDATNYTMLELGQPLHAFDRAHLAGSTIRVRLATPGERLTTLDGQERVLAGGDLLICDEAGPVALAGIMGGVHSEVRESTTEILLEGAVFRPATIRKTARRMGLTSEASYRMERGLDQPGSRYALNRAVAMMAELSGGVVLPGMPAAEPKPYERKLIGFRPERARKILGIPVEDHVSRRTLAGVGCEVDAAKDSQDASRVEWRVAAPSWRMDLEREIDLVEEVGRVWGLDRIPAKLPVITKSLGGAPAGVSDFAFTQRVKAWGRGAGLREAINFSFVGERDLNILGLPFEDRIPVANPLSEDQNVLRTMLAPGLLQSLKGNLAHGNTSLRLFEVAHVFHKDQASLTTASEPVRLGVVLYGSRHAGAWPHVQEDADYLDLKGLVEHLLDHLGLETPDCALAADHSFLLPCVSVRLGQVELGVMGRVRPEIAQDYHARKDVWLAELDLDLLKTLAGEALAKFSALPEYPPVRRDITLVAPFTLGAQSLVSAARAAGSGLMESVALTDVYAPEAAPERNLTLRITYRSAERTLSDKEVDKEHGRVSQALLKALPVRLQQ